MTITRIVARALAAAGLAVLLSAAAQAAEDGVARGKELAQQLCSPCHAIGPEGTSPNPQAPVFRELEQRLTLEGIEDVLAEEMALGHPPMPPWSFNDERLLDLVEYIASLDDKAAPEPR